jgi:hypothetical protein
MWLGPSPLETSYACRYRKRHKHIDEQVLKRWAWQILQGLVYLVSLRTCVVLAWTGYEMCIQGLKPLAQQLMSSQAQGWTSDLKATGTCISYRRKLGRPLK